MKLTLIQVPYDSGHYNVRLGRGPLHLIERGLIDRLERAGFSTELAPVRLDGFVTEMTSAPLLYLAVAERVVAARAEGRLPVVLAGNCNSAAMGSLAGLGGSAVVWMDAHGDLNTPETSASGFFDGMSLSVATGRVWRLLTNKVPGFLPLDEGNLIHVGGRDWDLGELNLLAGSPLTRLDVEALRQDGGVPAGLGRALEPVATRTRQAYLHFDLDVIDPTELVANEYAVPGGLMLEEMKEVARTTGRHLPIAAAGITAYDPALDPDDRGVEIAAALIQAVAESAQAAR